MRAPLSLLVGDSLRTLLTRRASALLLVLLFALLTAVSCSLQLSGHSVVNGQSIPIGDETRSSLAVGIALAGVHFLGLLLVLFLIVPTLTGEVETGLAGWILVKPIGRETYVLGRLLGAILFLAAFAGFVLIGLELLLWRYTGILEPGALIGWGILLLLLAFYLLWGTVFSLRLGSGFGGILLLLLSGLGAVVDVDALTRVFLWRESGANGAGIVAAILSPIVGPNGPPWPARVIYGAFYFLLPGAGNVHDLAVAATFGRGLPIREDLISFAILAASGPVGVFFLLRSLRKREF